MPKVSVKEGKLLCSYNPISLGDMLNEQIEEYKRQGFSEEEATRLGESDYQCYCYELWDDFLEDFGSILNTKGVKRSKELAFTVRGEDVDWQHSSCLFMTCLAEDGDTLHKNLAKKMLSKISPRTDYSIEVYNYGNDILAKIFHHDCPLGASFYLQPMAYSTYRKFNRV